MSEATTEKFFGGTFGEAFGRPMGIEFERLVSEAVKAAGDLWQKGWAERNAGNVSVRLSPAALSRGFTPSTDWLPVGAAVPEVGGEHFLFTGTGRFMRNVELDPARNLGAIELDPTGENYRVVWGYEQGGQPTSELTPHLRAHAARKVASRGRDRAVIHTHPSQLIALTYSMDLNSTSLTRLLWEMHTECIVVFPRGCGYLEWLLPGSDDLARATAEVLQKRPMALWQYHGIVAAGADLDEAFGLIDTAEKAARIYLTAASLGPVTRRLSTPQLTALAKKFGVQPDPEILGAQ